MKIQIRIPAPRHSLWTQESADSMIGMSFDAKRELPGGGQEKLNVGRGIVRAAKVEDDGRFIVADVDWPESLRSKRLR